MRTILLHLFVACITFFFGLGFEKIFHSPSRTTAPVPASHTVQLGTLVDSDEQKLRQIYREYGPAQTNHDRAFFERVESERFILFDWDRNLTREQDIREMERWAKDTVYECEVESIRMFGDSAVVTTRMHSRSDKGEVDSFRCIDVWIKEGHSWQILSTTAVE